MFKGARALLVPDGGGHIGHSDAKNADSIGFLSSLKKMRGFWCRCGDKWRNDSDRRGRKDEKRNATRWRMARGDEEGQFFCLLLPFLLAQVSKATKWDSTSAVGSNLSLCLMWQIQWKLKVFFNFHSTFFWNTGDKVQTCKWCDAPMEKKLFWRLSITVRCSMMGFKGTYYANSSFSCYICVPRAPRPTCEYPFRQPSQCSVMYSLWMCLKAIIVHFCPTVM